MSFLACLFLFVLLAVGVGQNAHAEESTTCTGNLAHINSITPYNEVLFGPGWQRTITRLQAHATGCYAALTTVRRWKYECEYNDQNDHCWEFVGDRMERFWTAQGNELSIGYNHWWEYKQEGSYSVDLILLQISVDSEASCWNTMDLSNWQNFSVCSDRNVQNFGIN